jgi:lysine-specific histone demethylase 1B
MGQEVLIIGAGIAGAACSLRLSEHGIKSIILEARNRIGGRIETVKLAENVHIDFGASNVHGYGQPGNPAQRLAEKLGIDLNVPKPEPGIVFDARKQAIPHERVSKLQKEIQRIMAHQEHAGEEDISLGARVVQELRDISPDAEGLARTAELGAGIRLEDISAKYWKTEKGFAGVDALPSGGYGDLVRKIIEASGAATVLKQEVISIQDTSDGVEVSTNGGQNYQASNA